MAMTIGPIERPIANDELGIFVATESPISAVDAYAAVRAIEKLLRRQDKLGSAAFVELFEFRTGNVDGALGLTGLPLPAGPLFLVDDMVDSRWTFTVAAWLLRSNGAGEVSPVALAQTGTGD